MGDGSGGIGAVVGDLLAAFLRQCADGCGRGDWVGRAIDEWWRVEAAPLVAGFDDGMLIVLGRASWQGFASGDLKDSCLRDMIISWANSALKAHVRDRANRLCTAARRCWAVDGFFGQDLFPPGMQRRVYGPLTSGALVYLGLGEVMAVVRFVGDNGDVVWLNVTSSHLAEIEGLTLLSMALSVNDESLGLCQS